MQRLSHVWKVFEPLVLSRRLVLMLDCLYKVSDVSQDNFWVVNKLPTDMEYPRVIVQERYTELKLRQVFCSIKVHCLRCRELQAVAMQPIMPDLSKACLPVSSLHEHGSWLLWDALCSCLPYYWKKVSIPCWDPRTSPGEFQGQFLVLFELSGFCHLGVNLPWFCTGNCANLYRPRNNSGKVLEIATLSASHFSLPSNI